MTMVIFVLLLIVPIVGGMIMSGGVGQFVDAPSAFIVIIPTLGTLLVGFKGSFLSSFSAIWQGEIGIGSRELDSAIAFWKAVKRCTIGYGCIGFMIGLVAMLGSLDDVSSIGPFMAVGLISIMYGIIVAYIVAEPMVCLLETKKRSKRI